MVICRESQNIVCSIADIVICNKQYWKMCSSKHCT